MGDARLAYLGAMKRLVLTVIGTDRPGLVDRLAAAIAGADGNWHQSHMARLAGHFAGIVEVTIDRAHEGALRDALGAIDDLAIGVTETDAEPSSETPRVARLTFQGQDRPGLVKAISRVLAQAGVNVDELETRTVPSPETGVPLFEAEAEVHLPEHLDVAALRMDLEAVARDLMVEVELAAAM